MTVHAHAAASLAQHARAALLREPLSFATAGGGLTLVPPGRCMLSRIEGSATLSWLDGLDGLDYRELALSAADLHALLSSGTLALDAQA